MPIYSELGIGYADTRYNTAYLNKQTSSVTQSATDNLNHGFAATGDLGYQFLPYMSIEGGAGYLPEYMATMSSKDYKIQSWFLYGAIRLNATMANDTITLYVKPGLAYRDVKLSDGSDYNSHYDAFYGAGGISYNINRHVFVGLEYNYIDQVANMSGAITTASGFNPSPRVNLYLAKVGYRQAMP